MCYGNEIKAVSSIHPTHPVHPLELSLPLPITPFLISHKTAENLNVPLSVPVGALP